MRKFQRKAISYLLILTLVAGLFVGLPAKKAEAASSKYMFKVNTQANVVTAYKRVNSRWVPVRAMRASTGYPHTATPIGTFRTMKKYKWKILDGPVRGRYCTRIVDRILFHSIWYKLSGSNSKRNESMPAFRRLGKDASHGCVRLSLIDAKWIYDNAAIGSKVITYKSSNPGPLGKPAKIYPKRNRRHDWDPTDPDPRNPNYNMKKPVFDFSKKKSYWRYGTREKLTDYVRVKNPNANEDISKYLYVDSIYKWSPKYKKYVLKSRKNFSTYSSGYYKVRYKVKYGYCPSGTATMKFKILSKYFKDKPLYKVDKTVYKYKTYPGGSGRYYRNAKVGATNTHYGITAYLSNHRNVFIKKNMKARVYRYNSSSKKYDYIKWIGNYKSAVHYKFSKPGTYRIDFLTRNPYGSSKGRLYRLEVGVNVSR